METKRKRLDPAGLDIENGVGGLCLQPSVMMVSPGWATYRRDRDDCIEEHAEDQRNVFFRLTKWTNRCADKATQFQGIFLDKLSLSGIRFAARVFSSRDDVPGKVPTEKSASSVNQDWSNPLTRPKARSASTTMDVNC